MLKCKIFDSIVDHADERTVEADRGKLENMMNGWFGENPSIEVVRMNTVALKIPFPHGISNPGTRTIIVYREK